MLAYVATKSLENTRELASSWENHTLLKVYTHSSTRAIVIAEVATLSKNL